MSSGLARLVALILLPGCSFVFTQNPPAEQWTLPVMECNSRYEGPAIDGAAAVISTGAAILISTLEPEPDRSRVEPIVMFGAMAVASAAGAVVGYRRVSACRKAKRLAYQTHAIDNPPAAEPDERAPIPGVALESQNLIPVDTVTARLAGSGAAVFERVDEARIDRLGQTLGTIYVHEKEADGTCDPSKAKLLRGGRPPVRRGRLLTEPLVRGLIKPEAEADLAFFARLGLEVKETVALIELRQTSQAIEDPGLEAHLRTLAAQADNAGRCLYYVRGVTGWRVSARVFDETTAKSGAGAWGLNVYGTYYASDGSVQSAHSLLLDLVRFELDATGISSRPLTEPEARAFEIALSKQEL